MKQKYVLVYAEIAAPGHWVLVVHKDRPEWQKGRINLIGGHVEEGETFEQAAVRELVEETGVQPLGDPVLMGILGGDWGEIGCLKIPVYYSEPQPREGETEKVEWVEWEKLRDDPRTMSNLRLLIPLMRMGVKDFEIIDDGATVAQPIHCCVMKTRRPNVP
jgi:8-oxo-dGTP pyrophosphatase MutT (NUDIX family)